MRPTHYETSEEDSVLSCITKEDAEFWIAVAYEHVRRIQEARASEAETAASGQPPNVAWNQFTYAGEVKR